MKNTILVILAVVVAYLLYTKKSVSDTLRNIASGVLPQGLTVPPRNTDSGSTPLPAQNTQGNGTQVVVMNGSSPSDDYLSSENDFNESPTIELP